MTLQIKTASKMNECVYGPGSDPSTQHTFRICNWFFCREKKTRGNTTFPTVDVKLVLGILDGVLFLKPRFFPQSHSRKRTSKNHILNCCIKASIRKQSFLFKQTACVRVQTLNTDDSNNNNNRKVGIKFLSIVDSWLWM